MNRYMTGERVAGTVRMLRSYHQDKSIMVVEGSGDLSAYEIITCSKRCKIHYANGRQHAIDAGRILCSSKFSGFLLVVDQDDWVLNGAHPRTEYLFWTDGRDLESTIFFAGAGDRLIDKYCSQAKRNRIEEQTGKSLLLLIEEWCAILGVLRWVSLRDRRGVACDTVDPFEYVDPHTLAPSLDLAVELLVQRAEGPLPGPRHAIQKQLRAGADYMLHRSIDKRLFCQGHDLCTALSSGLREVFGNDSCGGLSGELIEEELRDTYAWGHFEKTALHSGIRHWEGSNVPFRVLRDRSVTP